MRDWEKYDIDDVTVKGEPAPRLADRLDYVLVGVLLLLAARLLLNVFGQSGLPVTEGITMITDPLVRPFSFVPNLQVGNTLIEANTAIALLLLLITGELIINTIDYVRFRLSWPGNTRGDLPTFYK